MTARILRVALVIGACVDGGVGLLALFFQPWLAPLLDVPVKDPAAVTFLGGELIVVALLYVALARDFTRYRALLPLVALDQFFAAALPAYEIVRGDIPATLKTVGPIPLSVALACIYLAGLRVKPAA